MLAIAKGWQPTEARGVAAGDGMGVKRAWSGWSWGRSRREVGTQTGLVQRPRPPL